MKNKRVKELAVRLAAAFALLGALQAASLLIADNSSAQREHQAAFASIVAGNIVSVDRYQGSSYLALVGLATENWQLLLEQRQRATELARDFEQSMKVLLDGGIARIGGTEFRVSALDDAERRQAAVTAIDAWKLASEHQIKMLRSRDRRLEGNDELESFAAAARTAIAQLEVLRRLTADDGEVLEARVALIGRGLPVAATALVLFLAFVIHRRMVLPLDKAISDLNGAKTDLEKTVHKLATTQAELIQASRTAGMAEVASSVLHNVGNVLNSMGVGTETAQAALEGNVLAKLDRVFALIDEHRSDLGRFLSEDDKGVKLLPYIRQVAAQARADQTAAAQELAGVRKRIEHVMVIVAKHQVLARPTVVTETCSVKDIVQDSMTLCTASFLKYEIDVECDVEVKPLIQADRHKLMQILVNLLRNAKDALREPTGSGKKIRIDGILEGEEVVVRVADNGTGIAPEVRDQLFTHGFTTKPDGHGFGLHNSCLLAREMGGGLTCQSDGVGHGATFELRFPAALVEPAADRGAA